MQKYLVETPHYQFILNAIERKTPYHSMKLFVGEEGKKLCLDVQIMFPDNNERILQFINPSVAVLEKIEALEECSFLEISEEYMDEYSFGKEILNAFIAILHANIPHVKSIKFNDKSYIPCNRACRETLDLPTYYIALYGKTWYEMNFNAYISSKQLYTDYRTKVESYSSEKAKKFISFSEISLLPTIHTNSYAETQFYENYAKYEKIYNASKTLPEFFKQLNQLIERKDRCKFFKSWLEQFIQSKIPINREWQFDLQNNQKMTNILSTLNPKPMSHRKKTHKVKSRRKIN